MVFCCPPVCRSLPCEAKGALGQGRAQHLGGGGWHRHGPGLFNKLERGCRCTFSRLQLRSGSAAPSQCSLLPPDLPADQSVHVLPRSLQASSARLAPAPSSLAPAVLASFARSEVGKASPLAGRAAASWQEVVASSWGWDLLQKIQTNILGHEGSLDFRSPCGMLSNPSSPLGMSGVEGWTHRSRTAAAWEQICRH